MKIIASSVVLGACLGFGIAIVALSGIPAQGAEAMPAELVGHWETDLANCTGSATTGQGAYFAPAFAVDLVNNETEGMSCTVQSIAAGNGSSFVLVAMCGAEESEQSYGIDLSATVTADQQAMLLQTKDEAGSTPATAYHRCDQ